MLRHKHQLLSILIIIGMLIGIGILTVNAHAMLDDWHYIPHDNDCNSTSSVSEQTSNQQPAVNSAAGPWNIPGTAKYKLLQKIFNVITKTYGGSGAFAAGVLGNIVHESGLIPDIAEYYDSHNKNQTKVTDGVPSADPTGRTLRFGMNGTKPVNGMARYVGHEGGGGLFQFTPFTKFTKSGAWQKLNPNGWDPANQIAFVMDTNIINRRIERYMTSTNPGYGAAAYGKPVRFNNVEALMSTDNPRLAAEAFYVGYERGAVYHPEREDSAMVINNLFNKNDIKADKSKWVFTGVSETNTSKNSTSATNANDDNLTSCDDQSEKPAELLNANDYTGDSGFKLARKGWGMFIHRNQLPDNLKQYAIDPTLVGLKLHDCSGWQKFTNTNSRFLNGQCVALSKALFRSLWLKNGSDGPAFMGNGVDLAPAAARAWGGETSTTPSFGAIASISDGNDKIDGHTFIVSHVFKNGDILIIEQNVPGYSGAQNNNEECSWNYRLQSKSAYEGQRVVFFTPVKQGGTLNKKIAQTIVNNSKQ